jgi:hypothetical protein
MSSTHRRDGFQRRPTLPALVLAAGGVYGFLQWRGRTYGATWAERHSVMPGDDLVPRAQVSITHAVTVPGPPDRIWPWLVQVGWGRAGWYTPRWVDELLFPENGPSADRILPEWQSLSVGDQVPDGPPSAQCAFTVVEVEPQRCLVLRSTSHLPLSWREQGIAGVDWTWAFALHRAHHGRGTRLIFRWRTCTAPAWLTAAVQALVVPADYVMSRAMLRGIRDRVVASADQADRR